MVEQRTTSPKDDRRLRPRVDINGQAMIKTEQGEFGPFKATNVSLGGVFLLTDLKLSEGAHCTILLALPSAGGVTKKLILPCRVARVAAEGLGIQFRELTSEGYNLISTIVARIEGT